MSKSLGNVVDPNEVIDLLGVDALRFYFARNMRVESDSQISVDMIKQSYNSELGNKLGNLHSRLTKFVASRFDSRIPHKGPLEAADMEVRRECLETAESFARVFPLEQIPVRVGAAINSVERINQYITEQAPWTLIKNPDAFERCQSVVYVALDCLRLMLEAFRQVIPVSASKGLASLGLETADHKGTWLPSLDQLEGGRSLVNTDVMFPRVD